MKRKVVYLICMSFLFLSCGEKYVMPYTSGISIDEETLLEKEDKWLKSNIDNYSFTYVHKNKYIPSDSFIIDVFVKNKSVSEYELKEYSGVEKDSIKNWDNYTSRFSEELNSKKDSVLLIDNIYADITKAASEMKEQYKENPDSYFGNFDLEFSDEAPYIFSAVMKTVLMQEDVDGGSCNVEWHIENFKKIES